MRRWLRRLHLYAGLLGCTALLTFGAAGLTTSVSRVLHRGGPPREVRHAPFAGEPGLSDVEVGRRIHERFAPALAMPFMDRAARRNPRGELSLTFYTPNADRTVTWLEREGRVRIESRPHHLAEFLSRLHSRLLRLPGSGVDWRLVLWSFYVELSVYLLIFLPLSGVTLWLLSRPRHGLARLSFAAGSGIFLVLFWATR